MRKSIIVTIFEVNKNSCAFKINFEKSLKKFFKEDLFYIENSEIDFRSIPKSIIIIPVVLNLMPLVWLTGCNLYVDEIDYDLYNALFLAKENFRIQWGLEKVDGILIPSYIKKNRPNLQNACSLFSGGVDAITTALRNRQTIKKFISVWGADISVQNDIAWKETWSDINQQSSFLNTDCTFLRSNIKEIFNHDECNKLCSFVKDSYWHAAQHGLSLIGLSSLIAYCKSYKYVYISSSYTSDFDLLCASNPIIDGVINFFGCQVIHDGFELNRIQKLKFISENVPNNFPLRLKVCWQNTDGCNCCVCEKCLRTILMICALGLDPTNFGFKNYREGLEKAYDFFNFATYDDFMVYNMNITKNHLLSNGNKYPEMDWIKDFDFCKVAKRNKTFLFRLYRIVKRVI